MKERLVNNFDGSQGRIFDLEPVEVKALCRPGEGADTCIWLVFGQGKFNCLFFNRRVPSLVGDILEDRWKGGLTVAKRDGCNEIREYER